MRQTKRPDEVWFRWHGPDAAWEWSFDPPRKRDEGRWTRLVREDQAKARPVAAPELLAMVGRLSARLAECGTAPSDIFMVGEADELARRAEGKS